MVYMTPLPQSATQSRTEHQRFPPMIAKHRRGPDIGWSNTTASDKRAGMAPKSARANAGSRFGREIPDHGFYADPRLPPPTGLSVLSQELVAHEKRQGRACLHLPAGARRLDLLQPWPANAEPLPIGRGIVVQARS